MATFPDSRGEPREFDLNPGQRVGNDFEVVRPLAKGTTGPVYAAKQLSTGALRGLKIMHGDYAVDEPARRRFVEEARLGAKIESDHIVQVVGAGIDPVLGRPWLAMELLEGIELTQAIATRPSGFNAAETRDVFVQLCHAVGAAHDAGISHSDIRPENIFLARSRHHQHPFMVKVLDFGIARVVLRGATGGSNTRSRAWMAPEQIPAHGLDTPAADVWALGLVAFYLLTGKTYWLYATQAQALEQEVLSNTFAMASVRAAQIGARGLPDGFDDWFAKCVTPDANARFPNANACCAALLPLLDAAASRAGETSAGFFASLEASKAVPSQALSSLDQTPAMAPSSGMNMPVYMTNVGAPQRESHGPGATLVGQDFMPPGMMSSGPNLPSGGNSGTLLDFHASHLGPPGHGASGGYAPAPPAGVYPGATGYAPASGGYAGTPSHNPSGGYAPAGYASAAPINAYPAAPPPVGYAPAPPIGPGQGSSVSIPHPPPVSGGRANKSGSMVPILAAVGVLALTGGGVGIYFATRSPDKPKDLEERPESASNKPPASNTPTPPKSAKTPAPPIASTSTPKPVDRDATTGRMVKLTGGSFQMGLSDESGESPVRSVTVAPFEMDVTEVTMKAYGECASAGACAPATNAVVWPDIGDLVRGYQPACNANAGNGDLPVNCISYADAEKFCEWAGKRLPTEEEWDFAARGGIAGQKFPWGSTAPDATRGNRCGMECAQHYASQGFSANATYTANDGYKFTSPVAAFPAGATPTGLQDMEGNVWEWVSSSFCPYSNPSCGAPNKVIRGRSYDDYLPNQGLGPDRAPAVPTSKLPSIGFRCARSAAP